MHLSKPAWGFSLLVAGDPGLKVNGARALIQRLELLPPGADHIDFAHFLAIHEILKGALAASAQVQQQPVPVGLRVR